ncbi:hypothetical protein SAMN04515695_2381 [Pseudovibrio sp. Tun.PSC04-5.I4]|nr:hypothetical protein SAMN04515695_2381 [Pseudovibrio sp. Tun.PSC04-5.I4]
MFSCLSGFFRDFYQLSGTFTAFYRILDPFCSHSDNKKPAKVAGYFVLTIK